MIPVRLLLHPVLLNRRSRSIFFWYTVSAAAVAALLWWRFEQIATQSGIDLRLVVGGAPPLGKILFQPYIRALIVVLSAALACGITAISIVGPVRRLEEWLTAWELGLPVHPLKVRGGDQYETMIRLLNELREKFQRTRSAGLPGARTPMNKPLKPSRRSS